MKTIAATILTLFLAACGGGDYTEEERQADLQPLDCKARPEACK